MAKITLLTAVNLTNASIANKAWRDGYWSCKFTYPHHLMLEIDHVTIVHSKTNKAKERIPSEKGISIHTLSYHWFPLDLILPLTP